MEGLFIGCSKDVEKLFRKGGPVEKRGVLHNPQTSYEQVPPIRKQGYLINISTETKEEENSNKISFLSIWWTGERSERYTLR